MGWWKRPLRILQFNIEDRHGYPLLRFSPKDIIGWAEELGANAIAVFARDPWGRAFYRGSRYHPAHPLMRGDFLRELIGLAHKRSIKVILMVGHTADRYYFLIHTDWAQRNYRGEYIYLEHVPEKEDELPEWPQMCINSPFIEVIKGEVEEAEKLGADMVFLDSFRYLPDLERACYCEHCKRQFGEDKGTELAPDIWPSSLWRTQWEWRYDIAARRIREIKRALPLMYNAHPGGWTGRMLRLVERTEVIDVVFAEASEADHQPPGFIAEMVKLTRALFRGPVVASRNAFPLYRTTETAPPLAIRQGLRESMAAGGNIWLLLFGNGRIDGIKAAKPVFEEHEKLEPYLGARPFPFAAVLFSTKTMDHYGRDRPYRYVDEVRGTYYALLHSHIPVSFVSDRLEGLEETRVLFLPNAVCLDERQVKRVIRFAEEGGTVVATFMTAFWPDCVEDMNTLLPLAVKGVHRAPWSYIEVPEWSVEPTVLGDMSYDFRKERTEEDLGWVVLLEEKGLGKVGISGQIYGPEYTLGRSPPPLGTFTNAPFAVVKEIGDGKLVYMVAQIGRHYWRTGLPVFRELLRRHVPRSPVEVEGPETVEVEYMKQEDRLILHLINHSYNQRVLSAGLGRIKQALPPLSSPAVHPQRVVIPVDVDIRLEKEVRAYLPLRGRELGRGKRFRLNVGEYEVVVLEPI